jgi:indole-3-glycerol phosphate synthase
MSLHPVVEEILKVKRASVGQTRSADAKSDSRLGPDSGRRDLIESARSLRSQGKIPIIAEIKPKILGRPLSQDEVAGYASAYAAAGACGISVLTEPTHFLGALENLSTARDIVPDIPILRKDFIIDERQLLEGYGDLTLLIAALPIDLDVFIPAVRSYGSEPLVEVHTSEEMEKALKTDAKIIGINNRNLRTLEVDLGAFELLAPRAKDAGVFLVAESGVHTRADALRMIEAGADALLVGTSIMQEPARLAELNCCEK